MGGSKGKKSINRTTYSTNASIKDQTDKQDSVVNCNYIPSPDVSELIDELYPIIRIVSLKSLLIVYQTVHHVNVTVPSA